MNFDDSATAGLPRFDLLTLELIERRYNVIQAIEEAHKPYFNGGQINMNLVKARLLSLFYTLQSGLEKSMNAEDYAFLNKLVIMDKYSDIMRCFELINKWLYDKNLTKLDSRIILKTGRFEQKNKLKGLI